MHKITLDISDEVYEKIKEAIENKEELAKEHTVRSYLEEFIHNKSEVIVETL